MGCGSSSLKGEKVNTVNSEPPDQPIKRVVTNFSDIDFTGDAGGARRGKSFAVAPDEQRRPTRISETGGEEPIPELPPSSAGAQTGEKLAPYRTIDGDDNLASPTQTTLPTTSTAQDTHTTATQAFDTGNPTHQDPSLAYSSSLQPHEHEKKQAERSQS